MSIYDPETHKLLGVTYYLSSMAFPGKYWTEWTQLADNYFDGR